jgi:hypothetical protein
MMAPDSKRVILVLGSSMAGTRPLGLMDSKGSGLRVLEGFGYCFVVGLFLSRVRTFVEVAEVLEFSLVGDV